jgi:hypothetical protein
MTLIVGYASAEFAILASDRMISWGNGGFTEATIKTTFFRGQYLVGYSGVANLANETEQWLLSTLQPLTTPERAADWRDVFATKAQEELTRLARPADQKWFSVMVVGYASDPVTREPVPVLETLSNDRDPMHLHPARINPDFRAFQRALPTINPAHDFKLWAIGNVPSMEEMLQLDDAIARYRQRYPDNSREIARSLARCIVRRAQQVSGVGTSVQVTVMPRCALGQEGFAMGEFTEPLDCVTAIHFNPPIGPDGVPVLSGPNLVTADMTIMGPAMALGTTEEIGPRDPFIPPNAGF